MEWIICAMTYMYVIMVQVTGVAALINNADIIGMAVAGCAGFALLSVILSIIIMSMYWTTWFHNRMKEKGKVRMPKSYFKKKEEVKRQLVSGSVTSETWKANGSIPLQIVDKDIAKIKENRNGATLIGKGAPSTSGTHYPISRQISKTEHSTPWVQGWHQGSTSYANRIYEEKDATMELGEEGDNEYTIETEVVDNEILDVGPFRRDHSNEVPIKGDVYSDPYIYSTVDNSKRTNKKGPAVFAKPGKDSPPLEETSAKDTRNVDPEYSTVGEAKTNFEQSLLYL